MVESTIWLRSYLPNEAIQLSQLHDFVQAYFEGDQHHLDLKRFVTRLWAFYTLSFEAFDDRPNAHLRKVASIVCIHILDRELERMKALLGC